MTFGITIMIMKMFLTHWNTGGDIDVAGHRKGNEGDVGIGEGDVYGMHMIWVGAVLYGNSVFCQLRWNDRHQNLPESKTFCQEEKKTWLLGLESREHIWSNLGCAVKWQEMWGEGLRLKWSHQQNGLGRAGSLPRNTLSLMAVLTVTLLLYLLHVCQ